MLELFNFVIHCGLYRAVNVTRCQRHDAFKGEPGPLTIVVVSLRFNPPI